MAPKGKFLSTRGKEEEKEEDTFPSPCLLASVLATKKGGRRRQRKGAPELQLWDVTVAARARPSRRAGG